MKAATFKINKDVSIHYIEEGRGQPIIFIPGWTMTARFFAKQLPYFAKCGYRAIALDPRGQGLSSKPLEGCTFAQRAKDYKKFISGVGLKNVIIVGWSYGSYDMYSYFNENGTENLKACVCIDQPPVSYSTSKDTWNEISPDGVQGLVRSVMKNRRRWIKDYAKYMIGKNEVSTITWIVNQSLKTPEVIADALLLDGMFSDYRDTVSKIDQSIPLAFFVREDWKDNAKAWIEQFAPQSRFYLMPVHMGFWTEPQNFNTSLAAFLSTTK